MHNALAEAFNNAAQTYNEVSWVQKSAAFELVSLINMDNVHSVLDIGCGTGYASLALHDRYPEAEYTLCDISENMLHVASDTFPKKINTICCNAEYYNFSYYDIAISNLSIQWFSNQCEFIKRIKNQCSLFAFSTLLNTSFKCYRELFDVSPTHQYPSIDDLLELGNFKNYKTKTYIVKFSNFFSVIRYFKKLGAYTKSSGEASSLPLDFGPIVLTYDIFFGVL